VLEGSVLGEGSEPRGTASDAVHHAAACPTSCAASTQFYGTNRKCPSESPASQRSSGRDGNVIVHCTRCDALAAEGSSSRSATIWLSVWEATTKEGPQSGASHSSSREGKGSATEAVRPSAENLTSGADQYGSQRSGEGALYSTMVCDSSGSKHVDSTRRRTAPRVTSADLGTAAAAAAVNDLASVADICARDATHQHGPQPSR
jgi:hypothetical protein